MPKKQDSSIAVGGLTDQKLATVGKKPTMTPGVWISAAVNPRFQDLPPVDGLGSQSRKELELKVSKERRSK